MFKVEIRKILVVCIGNHCRSPVAQVALNSILGSSVLVVSAGLDALVGHPADPEVIKCAKEYGFDLSEFRGSQFTEKMALSVDIILVMENQHKRRIEQLVPAVCGRVFLLGNWLEGDLREIPDPFRMGPEVIRKTVVHIIKAVRTWGTRILGDK